MPKPELEFFKPDRLTWEPVDYLSHIAGFTDADRDHVDRKHANIPKIIYADGSWFLMTDRFSHLTAETGALFGARHYRDYSFLLTLSEHVAHFGLEHHECSDNRAPERMLIDEDLRKSWATLLPQGDNQVAGGTSLTIPDAVGPNAQRFYRIVAGN